jgi:uncharacterized iron-regulated membrane protein
MNNNEKNSIYRTIWRWHFYAGLFVMPMIILLSITGAMYLFKPQVERWEERAFQNLPTSVSVGANAQVDAALSAVPGAILYHYRLPEQPGDAAMVHVALPDGKSMRDIFVSPAGKVVGVLDPDRRLMAIVHDIHGQLLMGRAGSWVVELAASWAIVMLLTGILLWWPKGRGFSGTFWPRVAAGKRVFLRDLHAVTGFWVAGLAMILLLTGLPWADVWGSAFKAVRSEMGWVKGRQDWTIGGKPADGADHAEHQPHDHMAMLAMARAEGRAASGVTLQYIVNKAAQARLAFPVIVTPPGAPQAFGAPPSMDWVVRSDAQNRPLRVNLRFDPMTGAQTAREDFADKHVIDRVVGYGVAWHEGQLFGAINQVIGVLTALALIALCVTGFLMWRRRKPEGQLGAPPLPALPHISKGVKIAIGLLFCLLPLFALSLMLVLLLDYVLLRFQPKVAQWLGTLHREGKGTNA